ncbi:hypothetical protein ACHWQZ_G004818 [Mnemiopsis leidyi]
MSEPVPPGCLSTSPYTTVDLVSALEPYFISSVPCILLSIVTVTLNIFVIDYYLHARRSFVPLLYILISGVDILTGLGIIHQSIVIALFTREVISERALDNNTVFCYTLVSLCYKSSIFYNVVLAVSRTVMILKPFHQISIKTVIVVSVAYSAVWVGVSGYDIHKSYVVHQDFSYMMYFWYPVMGLELIYPLKKTPTLYNLLMIILLTVPFLLPVLITLVTCIVQVISLHSPNMVTSNNQRHVTITIVLMSTLFVVCNSAFSLFILIFQFTDMAEDNFVVYAMVFGTVLPILNAALNPVIIISRSKGLREGVVGRFRRLVKQRRKVGHCDRDDIKLTVFVNVTRYKEV